MRVQFRPLLLAAYLLFAAGPGAGPITFGGEPRRGAVVLRHGGFVSAVVFTPDGKELISGSGDGLIRVWDAGAGKELRHLGAHKGGVLALSLARDGRTLASGGADQSARLWDLRAGKELRVLRRERPAPWDVVAVALSPDGRHLAFADAGGRDIFLWARTGPSPYT
jgi:WD40 repeat protein